MNQQQRAKREGKTLSSFWLGHGSGKTAQRYIEEFLQHLITDDSPPRLDGPLNEFAGDGRFAWRTRIERIHKNVYVNEHGVHEVRVNLKRHPSMKIERPAKRPGYCLRY